MSFEIFYSGNIQSILQEYHPMFRGGLFGSSKLFLFQNHNLRQWVTLKLTEICGSHMALDSLFPDQALRELLKGFGPDLDSPKESIAEYKDEVEPVNVPPVLFLDDLKLVVFEELREVLLGGEPDKAGTSFESDQADLWAPLRQYLRQGNRMNTSKLYKFSQEVAGLFHSYAMNGPETWLPWLKAFQSGSRSPQDWQEALWKRVFFQGRQTHLGIEIHKVLEQNLEYQGHTREIIVFGSLFLSPLALDLLYRFSQKGKVRYFLYFPLDIPPQDLSLEGRPLGSWLKLLEVLREWAREKDVLWRPLASQHMDSSFPQAKALPEIFLGKEDLTPGKVENFLEYHNCSTKEREVEVLRDRIWNYLAENPGVPLEEIGVLAPDISLYAPWIESVFGGAEERMLPYNIVDLGFGQDSPLIQAFWALLELVGSPWYQADILGLLAFPAVQKALGFHSRDLDLWSEFTQNAGITHGWNQEHLKKLGLRPELASYLGTTWEQGFKRLVDGFYRAPREKDWLHFPETWPRLPLEAIGSGNFSQILRLRTILKELFEILERPGNQSLQEWSVWALDLLERFLAPPTEEEGQHHTALRAGIKELLQIVKDLGEDYPIADLDYGVFYSILRDKFRRMSGSKGGQFTEGVTCCSIGPFRSMPFRVIALLGMNQQEFPRSPGDLSINLLADYEKIWMDSQVTDNYSLLEILGSAHEHLWVFYCGIDPQTQVKGGPSLPLELFKEQAEAYLPDGRTLERTHSLVPYGAQAYGLMTEANQTTQSSYSDQNRGLRPTSLKSLRLTQALSGPLEPQQEKKTGQNNRLETSLTFNPDVLETRQFLGALIRPHQWFCRNVLGVYLPHERQEGDILPGEVKPWTESELREQILLRQGSPFNQKENQSSGLDTPLRWLKEEGMISLPLDRQYWQESLYPFSPGASLQSLGYSRNEISLSIELDQVGDSFQAAGAPDSDTQKPKTPAIRGALGFFFCRDQEVLSVIFDPQGSQYGKFDLRRRWKHFWNFVLLQADDPRRSLRLLFQEKDQRKLVSWNLGVEDARFHLQSGLELFTKARTLPLALYPDLLSGIYKKGVRVADPKEEQEIWEAKDEYIVPSPEYQLLLPDIGLDEESLLILDRIIPAVLGAFDL
jgi:hypothetical protein